MWCVDVGGVVCRHVDVGGVVCRCVDETNSWHNLFVMSFGLQTESESLLLLVISSYYDINQERIRTGG